MNNKHLIKPIKSKSIETSTKVEENYKINPKYDISTKSKSSFILQESETKLVKVRAKSDEYDLTEVEVAELEKAANINIISNIGYGGFSTVKLIYSLSFKKNTNIKAI